MTTQATTPVSGKSLPPFKPGDTVRVHLRVVEGESERVQVFEGVVIRRRGAGASESFTVRKISFGVGVERIFPVNSPRIEKLEVARSGRVRRARLNYLRKLSGRASRLEEEGSREPGSAKEAGGGSPEPAAAPAPAAEKAVKAEKPEKKEKRAADHPAPSLSK